MTVLFSDIRDFTAHWKRLSPRDPSALLNDSPVVDDLGDPTRGAAPTDKYVGGTRSWRSGRARERWRTRSTRRAHGARDAAGDAGDPRGPLRARLAGHRESGGRQHRHDELSATWAPVPQGAHGAGRRGEPRLSARGSRRPHGAPIPGGEATREAADGLRLARVSLRHAAAAARPGGDLEAGAGRRRRGVSMRRAGGGVAPRAAVLIRGARQCLTRLARIAPDHARRDARRARCLRSPPRRRPPTGDGVELHGDLGNARPFRGRGRGSVAPEVAWQPATFE